MSDKFKKLIDTLKSAVLEEPPTPLLPAQVTAITGETCSVLYGGLELTDVRLKATENGSSNRLLMYPKIGSMVLCGSLTGDLKDLAVLKVDELQKLSIVQDGTTVEIDTQTGKLEISNGQVSLKGLFQQMVSLLKAFKVYTPAGPSGTALPDTVVLINQFETEFKKLLK